MPSIQSGLEIDGQPMHDNLEESAPAAPAPKPTSAPATPDRDSAPDIAAGILSSEGSTSISDGMTFEQPPEAPRKPAPPMSPADQRDYDEAGRQLERDAADLAELHERRANEHLEQFWASALESRGDPDSMAVALADLREAETQGRISGDQVEEVFYSALESAVGYLEEFAEDEQYQGEFDQLVDEVENRAAQILAIRDVGRTSELVQQLAPLAAEERANKFMEVARAWAKDEGIPTDAEATQRLNAAFDLARSNEIDVDRMLTDPSVPFDAAAFDAVLRSHDAANVEDARIDAVAAFQRQVAGATSTSVSEGLVEMTPFGPMPMQDLSLPEPVLDEDAVVARSQRKRTTARSIQQSLLQPDSRDVASGFTDAEGRPTDADEATGGPARREQERLDQLARDRGLLR